MLLQFQMHKMNHLDSGSICGDFIITSFAIGNGYFKINSGYSVFYLKQLVVFNRFH